MKPRSNRLGVAPIYGQAHGYGSWSVGRSFGYGVGSGGLAGYGSPGGFGYGARYGRVNRGYGCASAACDLTDPVTGFIYYYPYGLGRWASWGSGLLPYGAYRIA